MLEREPARARAGQVEALRQRLAIAVEALHHQAPGQRGIAAAAADEAGVEAVQLDGAARLQRLHAEDAVVQARVVIAGIAHRAVQAAAKAAVAAVDDGAHECAFRATEVAAAQAQAMLLDAGAAEDEVVAEALEVDDVGHGGGCGHGQAGGQNGTAEQGAGVAGSVLTGKCGCCGWRNCVEIHMLIHDYIPFGRCF